MFFYFEPVEIIIKIIAPFQQHTGSRGCWIYIATARSERQQQLLESLSREQYRRALLLLGLFPFRFKEEVSTQYQQLPYRTVYR